MKTIVFPEKYIARILGKQAICEDKIYRLMRYIICLNRDETLCLHNVVTGQLIVLNPEEKTIVETQSIKYSPSIKELIESFFLVPLDYDEHEHVLGLRKVLSILDNKIQKNSIINYTILPTTACNARCYYCFEQGMKTSTMSGETADNVVEFITKHANGHQVSIRWFGGEPTLGKKRIDQICEGLHKNNVKFSSRITTNGYLFDKSMVEVAQKLWNLHYVMISVDGAEENYNRVKSFVNVQDSPFKRVIRNIGLFLERKINVMLRMNFDENNYQDFEELLLEIDKRFHSNPYLNVLAHQINIEGSELTSDHFYSREKWFREKIVELNDLSREKGFFPQKTRLPHLRYHVCEAGSDDSVTITPDGKLVSCPEQLGADQIKGDLEHGIIDEKLVYSWKRVADYERCHHCVLYPDCVRLVNCNGKNRCYYKSERIEHYKTAIIQKLSI